MPELANPKLREPSPPTIPKVVKADLPYAELDVKTNFSFLRGASHPDDLINRAAELGYSAIGVTDFNSLAGVVRMHVAAKQVGLSLIVGARLGFVDAPDLLVWCPDRKSYAGLSRLLTLGKQRAEKGQCTLKLADFLEHDHGLLAALIPPGNPDQAGAAMMDIDACIHSIAIHGLVDAMGDRLSLATSCCYGSDDASRLHRHAQLASILRIPLLATNDVYYHDVEQRRLHDVVTCVRHRCTIDDAGYRLLSNGERHLKSTWKMHQLFAAYPSAIQRGLEIAERCHFLLGDLKYEYPDELVPPGQTPLQYLAQLAWDGAAERYPGGVPTKVQDQINYELKFIAQLKYEAYFLTVYDLVRFARSKDILCQGRGSAANSVVCFCIGVTSVDPVKIDVLFERFISSARGEPPDIDIDFEHERREEVIQYVYEKYGRDRAGMTATLITYRGRSAVRDVGKAMGLTLDMVDSMSSKLDWWDRGVLDDDRIHQCGLDPMNRTIRLIIDLATQLLGFPRHLSQHVGGMVMTRGLLCELVPIENAKMDGRTVIEWDKDDIDALGLLKVDILALGMLTCIAKTMKLVDETTNASTPLKLHTIPQDDREAYLMMQDADTVGVFQIESRAQMAMLPRLKPHKFYDLVIEVAIVRPGPIQGNMVHPYLKRRAGLEPITFPSTALKQVLHKTLGVPLFQEQAMKITMVAAGFTAEEADQLRRAMAAWRRSGELIKFEEKIISGMTKNEYSKEFAVQCFNQIKGFGEYGFPESHAASFALLVYASAWLKRHHPAAFAAGLLNSQPMGFYQPAQIVRDAVDHGVETRPVDVNHSKWDCTLEQTQGLRPDDDPPSKKNWGKYGPALRLGFRQLKGFSEADAMQIIQVRDELGIFESVEQLHARTGLPAHAIRLLSEADAFSSLKLSRRPALWDALVIQDSPIPLIVNDHSILEPTILRDLLPAMPLKQEVMIDYSTIGLSLKKHPVALVRDQLQRKRIITSEDLAAKKQGQWVKVAGLVLIRQRPGTASGIVFETLEDETGIVNLIVKPDIYQHNRPAARYAALLQADGYVQRSGEVIHVLAKRLFDLSNLIQGYELSSRDFH